MQRTGWYFAIHIKKHKAEATFAGEEKKLEEGEPTEKPRRNSIERHRGRSRTALTSKMERFAIIINGFQSLTIITKCSILDVTAALDPPLRQLGRWKREDVKSSSKVSDRKMKSSDKDTIRCFRKNSEKNFKLRGEECNFRREECQLNKQQE